MTSRPIVVPLPRPHLEAVTRAPARPIRLRGWFVFTIVVIASFFLLIYSRIALDRSAFRLKDLEDRIAVEETTYWELRLEAAELQSPDRILTEALEMGLTYPKAAPISVTVAIENDAGSEVDDRWAELKALLSAQP